MDQLSLRRVPDDVTSGEGWHWDARGWLQVTGDGTVVESLEVNGSIDVKANNVTIRSNVIRVGGDTWGVALRSTVNAVVANNRIGTAGSEPRLMVGIKDIYGDAKGTVIEGNDIANTSTGVQIASGIIRGNYIHDLSMKAGDHVNGITTNGGGLPLVIDTNTVLNRFEQTDAIGLFQDFAVEENRDITGNLLAGGAYTIYGGDNQRFGPTRNIRITGNRFSRVYYPNGGAFGPRASFDPAAPGNVWSGNFWDEDGAPIS